MSEIVKRKKKGRPSKADLARRAEEELSAAAEQESVSKRSLRRRNVRYTFDYDDVIVDEEEDERRREKKLKQLKLQSCNESGSESVPIGTQRLTHVPDASDSSSGREDGDRPMKKRKIDGGDEIDEDDEDDEVARRKPGSKEADSVPGAPSDPPLGLPLPDGTSLELILDKLQKKDTYGVYAEPVDPDELPDYHDVIEHPMDFSTVRKKLGNGLYSALEQFESDVYLICANAMQYNAPDTIYYKQARSIQELAKQKFQELRIDVEQYEKELMSGQKPRSNSSAKQQIKKPTSTTPQEPVGSDFSSGTTLATPGDFQNASNGKRDGGRDRITNVDGPIVGNTSLVDNKLDKAEDLQGRVLLSRFGRKASTHDENRRATYSISNQPMVGSESIFTTFDGEVKQLVAVGIHADYSYARSLAIFAATLGPLAWKFASRRIEEALPPGFSYGLGWVGDYEPVSTPILMLGNCSPKEPVFLSKTSSISNPRKDDKTCNTLSVQKHPISYPNLQCRPSLVSADVTNPIVSPAECATVSVKEPLDGKQTFFSSGGTTPTTANVNYQQQNPHSRSNDSGKKVVKQLELYCTPISANQNTWSFVAEKQISNGLDVSASQSMDNVSKHANLLQSVPLKQPENCGLVAGGFPNEILPCNSLVRNRKVVSSSDNIPKQMVMSATYSPHGPEQGLGDPVHLMRVFAENAEKQQKSVNHSPVYDPSVTQHVPSSKRDDSNNGSPATAQSWMSIGSGMPKTASENTSAHKYQISTDSLYNNHTRELQQQVSQFRSDFPLSGMQFQPAENSFPFQAFGTAPIQMRNDTHFQNRELNFPPSVADLSRFHMQSPWQGLNPQRQPRQRQESLPPNLNIGVQSSGSPVGQSSAVMLDSQHPDLALQL